MIFVRGMRGLGDCIYQRAALRGLAEQSPLLLETPWPQLVGDLPISCTKLQTKLRAQEKNLTRADLNWTKPAARYRNRLMLSVNYRQASGSILNSMCSSIKFCPDRLLFDLPTFPVFGSNEPYIVVRPATVRAESPMPARNPLPEYLAMATNILRKHFRIVSVADLAEGKEWPLLPLPEADERFHAGELRVEELMALVAGAVGVVAGVGWAAPAAVAYRVPLFLIYGGRGRFDGPVRLFDSRMPTDLVHHAIPDNFCQCSNREHSCDKRISTIEQQIEDWTLGLLARRTIAMAA